MDYSLAKKLKDAGFPQNEWMIPAESEQGGRNWPNWPHCGRHLVLDEKDLVEALGIENCKKRAAFCYKLEYLESEEGKSLMVYLPTLSELIEACGDDFVSMNKRPDGWRAFADNEEFTGFDTMMPVVSAVGSTPEEAVARLWLALKSNIGNDTGKTEHTRLDQ